MRLQAAVLVATIVATACGSAVPAGIDRRMDLEVGDRQRTFHLYTPPNLEGPAPLVVVLHGLGGSSEEVRELTAFDDAADRHGFVVAYPQALGLIPTWRAVRGFGPADVEFAAALVETVAEIVTIDREAVFVAGMSNGGAMAARLGCDLPGLFAAVGSVAGPHESGACEGSIRSPLIAFHGTSDRIVPYAGLGVAVAPVETWAGEWADAGDCSGPSHSRVADDVSLAAWDGCPAPVLLYTIEDGRHGWPGSALSVGRGASTESIDATELMWQFFLDQSRNGQ